jgi:hypothetical protein
MGIKGKDLLKDILYIKVDDVKIYVKEKAKKVDMKNLTITCMCLWLMRLSNVVTHIEL